MATSGRGSGVVGYNVQVAVDTEHHLIVTHEVTNANSTAGRCTARARCQGDQSDAANGQVGGRGRHLRGYFSGEEILACEQAGITVTYS